MGKWGVALLGLGASRNQGWMLLLAFWCVQLQQSFFVCSLSPPASLWLLPSLPCAVSSMHVQQSHSLCPSSFVLAQSFLQRSSSFSKCNVHAFAFSTGYLLHISFLPCWLWLLCQYQGFNLLSVPLGFTSPPVCTIDLVHSALFKLHAVYAISHHTASSTSYSTFMY